MDLKDEILQTLSFYRDMNLEAILVEMDKSFCDLHRNLTVGDLNEALEELRKLKLVRRIKNRGEYAYRRIFPNRSIVQRLRRFIKNLFDFNR